jgi:hypothetical protein
MRIACQSVLDPEEAKLLMHSVEAMDPGRKLIPGPNSKTGMQTIRIDG